MLGVYCISLLLLDVACRNFNYNMGEHQCIGILMSGMAVSYQQNFLDP